MTTRQSLLPALFLLVFFAPLRAQQRPAETLAPAVRSDIDRVAGQVLQQTGVPSASIAVVQHGKIVYTHAYGMARLGPDEAATPQMRYSIGSISKQFTAAAILLLEQQGKLSLDDPVGKYISGLTEGDKVTLREILSHTSGYQDYWPEDYVMRPMMQPTTPQQILDTWAKKPLDFEPGTKWQYSNTNYVIAGLIVEKLSGEPLFTFLEQHIFKPLGMTSVWDSDQHPLTSTDAEGYHRYALGPLRPALPEGPGWMAGAAELAMTPHDLALWDESLLSQSLLSSESYKKMFTEVKLKDGKDSGYGLGVFLGERDGHRTISHTGEVSGFVSDNVLLPDDGVAMVVLTNQMAVSAASRIARLALPAIAGQPLSPPEQQALDIYRGLQHGQIDHALLAPNLDGYFTAQALADFSSSLGPLGEPLSLRQTSETLRGGMVFRSFTIAYPSRRLRLTTYTYPDGKLEQYLIAPAEE